MNSSLIDFDVVILGAGAAGLMAARVAGSRGLSVLVLEKANKAGKKILMSGGGRCNFTNYYVEADNFLSNNPHFCKSALKQFTQWDFIELVNRYEIPFEERSHGQLFCLNSAKDILAMLLDECEQVGVQIRLNQTVDLVYIDSEQGGRDSHFTLQLEETAQRIRCASLIVATGGLSIPTLGGSGAGYYIAEKFNLPLFDRRAGLVPFMFTDELKGLCERLSGVAIDVSISVNKQSFRENLLFTHRGMSGPSVLQISNYWHPGQSVEINLLPDIDASQWLSEHKASNGGSMLRRCLAEHFPKALVKELVDLWCPQHQQSRLADISDKQIISIGNNINHWQVKPSATEGYRTAEVTLGGVDVNAISSKTMEAKDIPGLFFIGEVLDVTGHLGGFNFQWAWSSGYVAGMNA